MLFAAFAALSPAELPAQQVHTGEIRQIRVDSASSASICVSTAPDMPGGLIACLYSTRPLFQEMKDLLLRAFERKARCAFEWTQVDSLTQRARIDALSCSL